MGGEGSVVALPSARTRPYGAVSRSFPCYPGRGASRAPAEHGARGQSAATWIVGVEKPAHELAGGVQARYRVLVSIQHAGLAIDAQATEREGYPASHREPVIGGLVERQRLQRSAEVLNISEGSYQPSAISKNKKLTADG